MSETILLTGGARSGKSALAEQLAGKLPGKPGSGSETEMEMATGRVLYIATAAVFDEEMEQRVKKHRAQRPAGWKTYEGFWNFNRLAQEPDFLACDTVLIDCLGFMLNNIMYHLVKDWEACTVEEMAAVENRMLQELAQLLELVRMQGKNLVAVTNEVGMGLVPAERSSRYYRDILGRANRTVAEAADRVYFMVSGMPLLIKGN